MKAEKMSTSRPSRAESSWDLCSCLAKLTRRKHRGLRGWARGGSERVSASPRIISLRLNTGEAQGLPANHSQPTSGVAVPATTRDSSLAFLLNLNTSSSVLLLLEYSSSVLWLRKGTHLTQTRRLMWLSSRFFPWEIYYILSTLNLKPLNSNHFMSSLFTAQHQATSPLPHVPIRNLFPFPHYTCHTFSVPALSSTKLGTAYFFYHVIFRNVMSILSST